MTLWRLAWRNVWRHRRRTVLLILVVAYAAFATILYWGINDGYAASVLNAQARFVGAPVLIMTPDYRDDPDPEHALPDLALTAALREVPRVRGIAPRLEFPALIRSAYTAESAVARGIEPQREREVSAVPAHIVAGRMLQRPGELVLGRALAERLDVRLGERAVVDTAGPAGPRAAGLVLVGLVETGVSQVDERLVLVDLADARRLTGVDTATALALDVPRGEEEAAAAELRRFLPPVVAAYGPAEMLGAIRQDLESNRVAAIPIAFLFALVAAAAVTSTTTVSVIERTREFGMIAAVGLAPVRLARVVVLESVITTVLGWIVGLAAGYGAVGLLARINLLGAAFGGFVGAWSSVPLTREIYTAVRPAYALYASMTVFVGAVLAALIPARRVRRLRPAQAMRIE
ncbi:MAG: FtsX-like permease family protein [Armatimonadota bacterium]|nr:FtsX-like permease family protein [Armatimonadota bacterium]MDR7494975.1 FtsX-like permease family protein [Armatimonadota bacterium]MDR7505976.1 FtsX-like permease family protein [Armatimonadota bacterium]MDR7553780.1 FtsX-like permease family protein [Armatimonadota bacterium]MDR7559373.1 FtsX-like permease family protein [Armatimonadota bacterium]